MSTAPQIQKEWTPSSWREKPIAQDVPYPDQAKLNQVLGKISSLPPMVTPSEIERLRHQLSLVQRGEAFLLHAGDCAESFDACTHENITNKIGLILSFSLILIWGARMPVVRVGRIAGQYAKPRSSGTEVVDGKTVLSFRGDNVNGLDPNDRVPDPERLLSAYFHSTTTLNYIRGLLTSGFASLHHPRDWSLNHVRSEVLRSEFEKIVDGLSDALDFAKTIGVESDRPYEMGGGRGTLGEVDFYTSHEGLMLPYEEALTRELPVPSALKAREKHHYNTGAHFIWIGDRTRQLTHAHIEYFRGIRNPIGCKVGPSMDNEELVRLLDVVNPDKESGRVTLITRYGAKKIDTHLAGHIAAVQKSGHPVVWICDPMHGNTHTAASGLKTRDFAAIIEEITACLRIHTECNSRMNGISLEFTGELNDEGYSVTECVGGSMQMGEEELGLRYQSFCDPRLNFEQSLDVAFMISDFFKKEHVEREKGRKEMRAANRLYAELGGRSPAEPAVAV
ncbi:DAHP synthetase [Coprinellus micaceus]|uniref:Phospho-2-dehydro-3-deoxyheptonate aldolase n=1 Tax=Coprinellus micaceus TaxID=71717 RepID=A0A4Y7TVW6_COPMI|nr:DAHP synthetase [Coprinellus micaceus]